jgi:hypothetical protein
LMFSFGETSFELSRKNGDSCHTISS